MKKFVTEEEIRKNEGKYVTMLTMTLGTLNIQYIMSTEIREILGFDEESRRVHLGPSLLLLPDNRIVDCGNFSDSTRAPLRSISKVVNESSDSELYGLITRYYMEHEYSVNGSIL